MLINNIEIEIEIEIGIDKPMYFIQEMLKQGFLSTTACYTSTAHINQIIKKYCESFEKTFEKIYKLEKKGRLKDFIEGQIAHEGFKRLN